MGKASVELPIERHRGTDAAGSVQFNRRHEVDGVEAPHRWWVYRGSRSEPILSHWVKEHSP